MQNKSLVCRLSYCKVSKPVNVVDLFIEWIQWKNMPLSSDCCSGTCTLFCTTIMSLGFKMVLVPVLYSQKKNHFCCPFGRNYLFKLAPSLLWFWRLRPVFLCLCVKWGESGEEVIPTWSNIRKQAFSILPVFAHALSAPSLCLPPLALCVSNPSIQELTLLWAQQNTWVLQSR